MKRISVNLLNNRIQNKIITLTVLLLSVSFMMAGCSKKDTTKDISTEAGPFVYCIDQTETKIQGVKYLPQGTTKEELVAEYLEALETEPTDITLKRAIPEGLRAEKAVFSDSGLSLYFNGAYNNLNGITEVLARACIIKTLCQIDGVEDVAFYVEGQPLKGPNESVIGFKNADDFIDDNSAENILVTVYFANEKGDGLVASNLQITYDGNIPPIEKAIIEALERGPLEDNMQKCIPDGTELLKVTTKDGICYVDFNDNFLDKVPGVKPEVVLYSVVNSLDELSTINKVLFTIDGSSKKFFDENIPFDSLFERNLDLLDEDK